MLAGAQTLLKENGRLAGEIILNDFLPPNVQADVLLERPQMASHSAALQQAVDEHVKPMTVRLFGNFQMSKSAATAGYLRARQPTCRAVLLLTRHGAQPCLMLRADNNICDFSNCVFTVDKLFQDGAHIAGYQGDCRAEHMGALVYRRHFGGGSEQTFREQLERRIRLERARQRLAGTDR